MKQADIKVVVDGKILEFDVPPIIVNDRILVPLRGIFEEFGANVDYQSGFLATITAKKGNTTVSIAIGSSAPTINGQVTTIDQPCILFRGRTLAPLRFVAEAFGGTVAWDGGSSTAFITSG